MKDAGWAEHGIGKAINKKKDPDNPFDRPEYFNSAKEASKTLGVIFRSKSNISDEIGELFPKVNKQIGGFYETHKRLIP